MLHLVGLLAVLRQGGQAGTGRSTGSIERLGTVGTDTNGAQRARFSTLSRLFRAPATSDNLHHPT